MNGLGTKFAWIFSFAFLLATVVGFIPNPVVGEKGFFLTNTPHNIVHLLTAIAFAFAAIIGNTFSTLFMKGFGIVYLIVGILGVFITGTNSEGMMLGLIHINSWDNYLHMGLGAAIFTGGFIAGRSQIPQIA